MTASLFLGLPASPFSYERFSTSIRARHARNLCEITPYRLINQCVNKGFAGSLPNIAPLAKAKDENGY
jgi:hypothetical protein